MIRVIRGIDAPNFPSEMDAMFKARALVFHHRLGWKVTVTAGREIDSYDKFNPLYLLCIDDVSGTVRGSLRLLRTTGPNMLRDQFSAFFDQPLVIESHKIWECTRFCVHPEACGRDVTATGAMRTTWEMMLGICEVGLMAGLTHIQGVYDQYMIRVYRKTRWTPRPLASTDRFGRATVYVGLWEVSHGALAEMQCASSINRSVLETENAIALSDVA
jgi:acyl homoserine lactone synthase